MLFDTKLLSLRDGSACVLRAPREEDAAELLRYLQDTAVETPYLLRTSEEAAKMPLEAETAFIAGTRENPNRMMLLAEVNGRIAGTCDISFTNKAKMRHRASIGIALRQAYWGKGIGTAMFREMIALARARDGVRVLQLEYIEGNARARALYEKMGFRVVSVLPNAIQMEDCTLRNEYVMQLCLE